MKIDFEWEKSAFMKNSPVSIIIPSHNYAQYLPDAVESALRQDYDPLEIIIVNDASTDNIDEVAKHYLADKRVKYISLNKKSGLPVARNEGIKISSGEYINFLDADDILEDNAIVAMAGVMDKNPQSAVVVGRRIDFYDSGNFFIMEPHFPDNLEKDTFRKIVYKNFVCVSGTLVRRACLESTGCFNPEMNLHEDYDLWMRLAYKFPFSAINCIVVRKRSHRNNMSHPRHLLNLLVYEIKARENILEIAVRDNNTDFIKLLSDSIMLRKKWLGKEACLQGEFEMSKRYLDEYMNNKADRNLKLELMTRFPVLAHGIMKLIKSFRGVIKSVSCPEKVYDSIPETIPRLT